MSSCHEPRGVAAEARGHPTTDVSLIDAMLALTPEERLRQNDRMLQTIQELRDGFAASQTDHPARPAGSDRG